jgi:hypothetical protein
MKRQADRSALSRMKLTKTALVRPERLERLLVSSAWTVAWSSGLGDAFGDGSDALRCSPAARHDLRKRRAVQLRLAVSPASMVAPELVGVALEVDVEQRVLEADGVVVAPSLRSAPRPRTGRTAAFAAHAGGFLLVRHRDLLQRVVGRTGLAPSGLRRSGFERCLALILLVAVPHWNLPVHDTPWQTRACRAVHRMALVSIGPGARRVVVAMRRSIESTVTPSLPQ